MLPGRAAGVTLHGQRIDVPLRHFVVPLLIGSPPDLARAAVAACERTIDVELRQFTVGVDVPQLIVGLRIGLTLIVNVVVVAHCPVVGVNV